MVCFGRIISANGKSQTMIVTNTKKSGLIFEKYDSVTKQTLAGVQIKVTTANKGLTNPNGLYTTDANGDYVTDRNGWIVLNSLTPSTTVIAKEIRVAGYKLDNYIEDLTVSGRYFLKEMGSKGDIVDTELKIVYVTAGGTTLVGVEEHLPSPPQLTPEPSSEFDR